MAACHMCTRAISALRGETVAYRLHHRVSRTLRPREHRREATMPCPSATSDLSFVAPTDADAAGQNSRTD